MQKNDLLNLLEDIDGGEDITVVDNQGFPFTIEDVRVRNGLRVIYVRPKAEDEEDE